jgi:hypothetical protein
MSSGGGDAGGAADADAGAEDEAEDEATGAGVSACATETCGAAGADAVALADATLDCAGPGCDELCGAVAHAQISSGRSSVRRTPELWKKARQDAKSRENRMSSWLAAPTRVLESGRFHG